MVGLYLLVIDLWSGKRRVFIFKSIKVSNRININNYVRKKLNLTTSRKLYFGPHNCCINYYKSTIIATVNENLSHITLL